MALTEFTTNVENISALNDQPSLTANQLKATFDKAGKDIKTYINGTLKTFVDALYKKPGTGIPKTDLASDVQTSLGKADSALQSIAASSITTNMLIPNAVTSSRLAMQSEIYINTANGSDIYGSSLPGSGTTGQIFFKRV